MRWGDRMGSRQPGVEGQGPGLRAESDEHEDEHRVADERRERRRGRPPGEKLELTPAACGEQAERDEQGRGRDVGHRQVQEARGRDGARRTKPHDEKG